MGIKDRERESERPRRPLRLLISAFMGVKTVGIGDRDRERETVTTKESEADGGEENT